MKNLLRPSRCASRQFVASAHDVAPEMLEKLLSNSGPQPSGEKTSASKAGAFRPSLSSRAGVIVQAPLMRQPEPVLLCNELDAAGNMHVTCGKFLKSTLCATHGLLPRDLRKLDGTLKNQLPVILVRSSAILVNLDPIRAIIRHNGVIIFESVDLGERDRQHSFIVEMQTKLRSNSDGALMSQLPFEFQVLETILQKTLQSLQDEFDAMAPVIEEHLRALQNYIHWERLRILLECRRRITLFQERVHSVRSCLSELLESDDDMAGMYLSHKVALASRPVTAHEEIELLLESYLKIAEEISSHVQVLVSDMQSTEDIVNISLVGKRNELLLLDLKLAIGTFAASMGGFGASVLGMNLPNHLESSKYAFFSVLAGLLTIAAAAFTLTWRRLLFLVRKK